MAVVVFVGLLLVLFYVLLYLGRTQIALGTPQKTANGAVLLTLATVIGVLAFGLLAFEM